ncbi:MAG: translation initiation factor IF-2 [Lachnospiraceae bacterium]|nr:translation initiation factor IF-2 [Lachnospiraceae bacterium]
MSKIRVHELAKELNINSKEIMTYLEGKKIEAKSHMSTIEEGIAQDIRTKFGGKKNVDLNNNEIKEAEVKTKATEKPAEKGDGYKKKASISAVYNPQYGKDPNARRGQRKTMSGTGDKNHPDKKPRPAAPNGERRPGQGGERRPNPNGERRPMNHDRDGAERRPYNKEGGERKPFNRDGNRSDRKPFNKEGGERKPFNRDGNRSDRRPFNKDGGDRKPFNKDGHNNDRRNNNSRNNRLDGEINRMNRSSDTPTEEKPKDRENKRFKNKPQKNNYNHKDKKQENFFQLEKVTRKKHSQPKQHEDPTEIKTIVIPETLTIRDLAEKMKRQPSELVKKLFLQGKVVTVNQDVDFETAEEIALEFNCICEKEEKVDIIEELLREEEEDESLMTPRPPVVCVMGHVDHGKTSLLDAIRDSHVIDREAGGITQHIGASVVECNGQPITFLDTPGHEAFTAMRMRGANSTDIAILVVAADDGVMPQTVEAINHAKAAGIEIIVAINKIDKPSANIDKVKQELSEYELIPEDWGGSTIFVPVSAHTHEGIDVLLEMVLLTAEVLELKANKNRKARGLVIEAKLDKGRGVVASLLVQKGVLHVGDPIAAGSSYGKVRAMVDSKGKRVKEAGPSMPVEIIGLNEAPGAGDIFVAMDSDKEARNFAETFIKDNKEKLVEETKSKMSLDDLFSQIQAGNLKELNIIVKADVQGSVEAVKQSLVKLSNDEVVVKVIHGGVGAINESDVILASASNAIIIGFNIRPDAIAKATADREGVDIRLYKVIYNAIEDVEAAMKGMLDPIFEEQVIGHAEIRQIFKASGVGNIAGSYVLDGRFQRGCSVRITREGEQIFEGPLASLKRFKDDVKEVKAGFECGLVFEGFGQIQELDQVEAYIMVEIPR